MGACMRTILLASVLSLSIIYSSAIEAVLKPKFDLIFLGDSNEANQLSGLLVAPFKSKQYISIDAGSIDHRITQVLQDVSADDSFFVNEEEKDNWMLKEHVKAHLISRPHINHLAALLMYSSIDRCKNIYGIDETINNIRDHLFNWVICPNYADEGRLPHLKRYHYVRLPLQKSLQIPKTKFQVEPFLLRNLTGQTSTCFLLECEGEYFVYFGNLNLDAEPQQGKLGHIWERIAPLISQKKCHALFFEFTGNIPNTESQTFEKKHSLYLMNELQQLAETIDPKRTKEVLSELNVILSFNKNEQKMHSLLTEKDNFGIKWFFPKRGEKLSL